MSNFRNNLYYHIKPLIPRSAQIFLRRRVALSKLARYAHVWPIDERAATPPEGWPGWPEGRKFAFVLTHDVETAKGVERCIPLAELEKSLGFRSSFNFVAGDYEVPQSLIDYLTREGFEIGVHGLYHDRNLFRSRRVFEEQVPAINQRLKEWGATGFRTPSMYHNLDWLHDLDIQYDSSTFDTDPFEPQPDGVGTIFPFWVPHNGGNGGYVELPYTLPQDFTVYVVMKEKTNDLWRKKLDWIAGHRGMALLIAHPDYMHFGKGRPGLEEFPSNYYYDFLRYVSSKYTGQYWHSLPRNVAAIIGGSASETLLTSAAVVDGQSKRKGTTAMKKPRNRKIWIDLDNSPHVPLFKPIIEELEKRGYPVVLTARDCSQTCGLADLFQLRYKSIGRHYGKNKAMKLAGLMIRSAELSPSILEDKPAIAVSHGSRSQHLLASVLGIPTIIMEDYEHVTMLPFSRTTWIMTPEAIPPSAIKLPRERVLQYPGIKEDVYVPTFLPDPSLKQHLGLQDGHIVATVRPPATEAHYHNPESEKLFEEVVSLLDSHPNLRMVMLPRYDRQAEEIRQAWPEHVAEGRIIIPGKVVDGLNLIWYSDLVVSGGGTMNREAAALGVPVYSIFRGRIGAVDRYLSKTGRLVLLESPKDVREKIRISKRSQPESLSNLKDRTLQTIVDHIVQVMEKAR